MDITTVGGILGSVFVLFTALLFEGGHVSSFLNVGAIYLVIAGTFTATASSYPLEKFKKMWPFFLKTVFYKKEDNTVIIHTMIRLAEKARREGLLALEDEKDDLENPFFQKGLQLVVDGIDPTLIRNILETEITLKEEDEKLGVDMYQQAGIYAPTIGIIGTVMGLVHMLEGLGESSGAGSLGKAVAVAFIATFTGVSSANLVYLPISKKLKMRLTEEINLMNSILEGILAIQGGDNPAVVREKLKVFFPDNPEAFNTDRDD
jgi:chemotaxis protein MotA